MKTQDFSLQKIFDALPSFSEKGITELSVSDRLLSSDKEKLIRLTEEIKKYCPDLFVSIVVSPSVIDKKLIEAFKDIFCSLEIPFSGSEKGEVLLFDKKFYSSKAHLLNDAGLVFGFDMDWGLKTGDTFKSFRNRLDFAVSLYPNHIDFAQLEGKPYYDPRPTGIYSSKDLDFSRGMAFACKTFYSAGRAVPWFCCVLKALRLDSSSFFADFEEFQLCNNCSFESGFKPEEASHQEIEKLQLMFLQEKFEEKGKAHLFQAVSDIVRLNGALSRVSCEGETCKLEISYHPNDLLSPYTMNLSAFCENVTMERCSVEVFEGKDGPSFKVL